MIFYRKDHSPPVFQYRLCLSALHYNENADRMQAVAVDGRPCYSIRFPKAKQGGHAVREIKTKATYGKRTAAWLAELQG